MEAEQLKSLSVVELPPLDCGDCAAPKLTRRLNELLCTHNIVMPNTGEIKPVHGTQLYRSSLYFAARIYYSKEKVLRLPWEQYGFFEAGISALITGTRCSPCCGCSGCSRLKLTEDNCLDIYLTADYVLNMEMRAEALEFIQSLCAANIDYALAMWKCSDEYFLPDLSNVALNEILAGFPSLSIQTSSWMSLSPDQVYRVLQHDSLNCHSESWVVQAATMWLSASWSQRKQYAEQLMACTRVELLKREELLELWTEREVLCQLKNLKSLWNAYPFVPKETEVRALFQRNYAAFAKIARPRLPYQAVFVFGGWGRNPTSNGSIADVTGPQAACQMYNPRSDSWILRVPDDLHLPTDIGQIGRRVYAGCLAVRDIIYVVGGFDGNAALRTVSCYNLRCPKFGWYVGSRMLNRRYYVCCASVGNLLYAIGGHSGEADPDGSSGRLNSVERMCVNENIWKKVASLCVVRSDAGAASLGDRVFVAGGFDGQLYHDSAEVYDPGTNQWTLIRSMRFRRGGVALVALGNAVYALGGNDSGERLREIEKYQSEIDEWKVVAQLPKAKSNMSAAAIDERFILVIGGWSDDQGERGVVASVEKFCTVTGAVVPVADVRFAASATAACSAHGRQLFHEYFAAPSDSENLWKL